MGMITDSARIDVIVLDIMMPGEDGLSLCRRLKGAPETADISVLVLKVTSRTGDHVRRLSVRLPIEGHL